MELHRFDDWHDRLATYFAIVDETPFEWGTHDCALFAASAIQRMTGVDIAADFRGKYSDNIGAALALREYGAGTLQKTFTALLGASKHISRAHRGDVVCLNNSMGICGGSFSRFVGEYNETVEPILNPVELSKRSRLIPVPTLSCQRAWSVPF